MKKGCLIAGIGIPLVLIAAAAGAGYYFAQQYETQYGWKEAPAVSHAFLADEGTRFRAMLEAGRLKDIILANIPERLATQVPSWAPMEIEEIIPEILPHEVALLAGTDYDARRLDIQFFLNERRFGPLLAQFAEPNVQRAAGRYIDLPSPAVEFKERGQVHGAASLPIPKELEQRLLEEGYTPRLAAEDPEVLRGGHMLEALLDNRNGEAVALMGIFAEKYGAGWQPLFADRNVEMLLEILKNVYLVRLHADFVDLDTAAIHLRIDAHPDASMSLTFLFGIALPELRKMLEKDYNLILEGKPEWSDAEEAYIGDFTLSGIDAVIKEQVAKIAL